MRSYDERSCGVCDEHLTCVERCGGGVCQPCGVSDGGGSLVYDGLCDAYEPVTYDE